MTYVFTTVFEVSSEVARKIGGIYTVIQTKSSQLVKELGDNYITIGMYDALRSELEFQKEKTPENFKKTFEELEKQGIACYYGRWIDASNARCILIDASKFSQRAVKVPYKESDSMLNSIKYTLWKEYGIDSLFMDWDFNEAVSWAWAAGMLIEKLVEGPFSKKCNVAHFHEWLAGAGLLYLKLKKVHIGTVFTTHATALGRSLMSFDFDLQKAVSSGIKNKTTADVQLAFQRKVEGKHLMESACAKNSDVFTTVSEPMSNEVQFILGKKPDVITPNALDFTKFPAVKQVIKMKQENKDDLNNLLISMFCPYYAIELKDKLLVYISGRYEMKNKGIDIFIRALGDLNEELKKLKQKKQIFAFIFVPTNIIEPKEYIMMNMLVMSKINDLIQEEADIKQQGNIIQAIAANSLKIKNKALEQEISKLVKSFEKQGLKPPISAFELAYSHDAILDLLAASGLENNEEDVVKIVFYPTYLNPGDKLLNMSYNSAISAFDAGVFPSRYEPWGYTPVEAGAYLSLAVTTDLAGFGKFLQKKVKQNNTQSIKVLEVEDKNEDEVVIQLKDYLKKIFFLKRNELEKLQRKSRKIVELSDWKSQVKKYYTAYNLAVRRTL